MVWQLPFPVIVIGAALIGVCGARLAPAQFANPAPLSHTLIHPAPALIDDHSPLPEHAQLRYSRLLLILLIGLGLWAIPLLSLISLYGWHGTLTQMAWFFSKAAVLTFGGAYAVLPYIYQGAVEHFAWVTPAQMIDALALGESTPGPLIMLLAFVGFLGGYSQHLLGPEALFWAGALAAVVVTWFTFLPSFLLILLGGPFIESTRDTLQLTAPLSTISAAVVGVIVNLSVFFTYHVLWPQGFSQQVDWPALGIGLGAASALFVLKRNVMEVLLLSALAGLVVYLLR